MPDNTQKIAEEIAPFAKQLYENHTFSHDLCENVECRDCILNHHRDSYGRDGRCLLGEIFNWYREKGENITIPAPPEEKQPEETKSRFELIGEMLKNAE